MPTTVSSVLNPIKDITLHQIVNIFVYQLTCNSHFLIFFCKSKGISILRKHLLNVNTILHLFDATSDYILL